MSRGSRGALVVLSGTLVYLVYSFVLYAFAMHFNVLFLVYCATLGVSFYLLLDLALYLSKQDGAAWFGANPRRTRATGIFLLAIASVFALLWLSSVIPALLSGEPPRELAEVGLISNPVHVLDLAIVLPGLAITGILVLHHRPSGYLLAPILLTFNVVMITAIIGMNLVMWARGLAIQPVVVTAMIASAAVSKLLLLGFLRQLRPAAGPPPTVGWLDQPHRL
jgi:hypothetical protein